MNNSKILNSTIMITQLLHQSKCTYKEADKIIYLLHDWIKQSRENKEYITTTDYVNKSKSVCADDIVVEQMNTVEINI